MNKIFKVIWSKSKQCYVVVSEIAKNKTGKKKIVVAGIFAALAMVGTMQHAQAVDGPGRREGWPSGVAENGYAKYIGTAFDPKKGLVVGPNMGNNDTTRANGNVATVAIGAHSNATGSSSVAIGGAVVNGAGAIGLGWSTANGDNSVALGGTGSTIANGNNAFAASGGNANGESATAIGSSAIADGRGGVAVGWNAESKVNAVGIGFNAKAKANNTIAIGVEANNDKANAISNNYSSVSIGVATRARAVGSMAMGVSADASGKYSIALGSGNVSGDYTATANYPKATGEKAIAIGYDGQALNINATAVGSEAHATGKQSAAYGFKSQASEQDATAIGSNAIASAVRTTALGVNAQALGSNSVAIGGGAGGTNVVGFAEELKADGGDITRLNRNINIATTAEGDNAVALGYYANAANGGVAIGQTSIAATGGVALGQRVLEDTGNKYASAVVIGQDSTAKGTYSVSLGRQTITKGSTSLAMGNGASANGDYSVAMGRKVVADDTSTAIGHHAYASKGGLAIGAQDNDISADRTTASAKGALAIGKNTKASAEDAVAIGTNAQSTLKGAVALGSGSTTATTATKQTSTTVNGIAYNFAGATSDPNMQVSVGAAGKERQIKNVAAGEVSATSTDAINGSQLFAVASQIKPIQYFAVNSSVAGNKDNSGATGSDSVAIGPNAKAQAVSSIALGNNATAAGGNSIAIGNTSSATDKQSPISIGYGATANGDFSVAIGGGDNNTNYGATANGVGGTALGGKTKTTGGNFQTAVGYGATTTAQKASAFGYNATTSVEGGVALGFNSSSTTGVNKGYNPNDNRTNKYDGLKNNVLTSTTGAIAVGNGSTVTRQITGVAAGTNDTDAVNVAQLKSVNLAFKGNVGSGDVNLATNDSDKKLTIQGDRTYITTNASGNTLTIAANKKDINVTNGTARADAGVADAKNVAEAINNAVSQNKYKWYLTADNDTGGSRSTIDKEGTVKFSGDSNINVSRNGNTITTSLNKAITVDSVKANKTITVGTNKITLDGNTGAVTGKAFNGDSFTSGNNVLTNTTLQIGSPTGGNNVTITRDGLTAKAGTKTVKFGTNGINAGDQQINNVASAGGVSTNAANYGDVKNAVSGVTLKINDGKPGSKDSTVNLSDQTLVVKGGTGIQTSVIGQTITVKLDNNTENATTKGIGIKGDSEFATKKYLKDGDAIFNVSGDGSLVTTKSTTTGVQVSVNSAKVKDLAVDAVTVSKATNIPDNPITVTPTAGTNSKDYAIGIDTTKLAAKTKLAYTANGATAKTVSLAKGLNFVNGINTVSSVDSDGKVSFDLNQATKDSINKSATAVGRTITLNADSGTGSSQSLSNGNVSFAVSGATGDYISTTMDGSAVKVSTKRATINSDANTGKASVTGADGLATAKNVASAINSAVNGLSQNLNISDGTKDSSVALKSQKLTITGTGAATTTVNNQTITVDVAEGTLSNNTDGTVKADAAGVATTKNVADVINKTISDNQYSWKLSANGEATTATVGKGDTVDFTGDTNITVDRNNKNVSVSLNKNLTDMNSISLGNARGETIFLNGRDGSIKAGKAEFKDNVGAGSTITSDQLSFTNGATGANESTTTIALDTVSIQSGPNSSALTSKDLTFSDEDGNIAEGSAKGMGFQNAAGKLVQFTVDEIKAGGNKIKEVAEGTADTDAVNVKQLKDTIGGQSLTYRANTSADTDAKSVKLSKGLDFVNGTSTVASVDEDGKVSFDLNTATKTQINTNTTDIATNKDNIATNTADIATNKGKIATNTTNIATNTANIAHTIALADDNGASTTAKSLKDGNVSFNIKGDNKFISTAASGNDVTLTVNEQAIKDAAKAASSFKVKANTHAEEEVKGGDTIAFNNGDNIEISQTGKTFTIKTAKNITVDSVTAGNTVINTSGLTNGTTAITGTGITTDKVTVGGISIDKTAGINAGGKVISNVASGTVNNNATDDSNAANIGDVKQAVANLSQNLNITDGTNNGTVDLKNQKLNVAGANGVTATVNNQTITVGLDANTVNATTKGIGLTADTGSTGNKYLKDGDVSFAVTGDGNLVSTSATAAGVKVAVDTAKVKDLAVAAVTVSKDTQADNPITVTPTAGTNSKDYAIGIDTTKLAAKTDLTYRANSAADANAKKVSLSKGLDFVDGGSTVATVDNDGKVSFDLNTATKNQINTNTTDIATNKGKIATNTTNIAANTTALARNISLGADTGTASSQSLSTADVAFNVKGATGDFVSTNMNGNTVEISTKRATINSNATTGEASVTGNDGLATAQNVADAINKAADAAKAGAAWNITTNSSTTDKTVVKGGDTVDLINGDNIEITQDGTDKKKITVATKKDITVDSVTANNKVTVGSGANAITLNGADGSVTGKAFTGTTFTGTSFTAGNTVINTSGLTNGTTAITGTGVTTDKLTVGGISVDKTDGINAGGKVISNVASGGTTDSNAANIGDVKQAVANLSQNLNITDGTNNGTIDLKNQKLNVAGANGVTATVKDQTITVGLDANTVNATTKGIGLTGDTGSTGNKYLKDGDVSFAVTGDGSLVSTSATAAGVKVAVNSASITAGADGTITGPTKDGVATAKNVADAINAAKKASKTEITANTGEAANATTGNVTLTSTTAADGHTIYDVKLNDKVTLGSGTNAVTVDGTTGAITGKKATIGGVTVNGTANTIGGLSNTTWNGTAVSGRAATEDQLKAATGATTLKFTGDVATNTGSVNLKDDTFGIKGDGKYISTDVNGKNVNLTVSEAEVKKSAVAAVTVSTDTTDANNPLTVTPTTSADGTTKDYKVTIDGTKIANKTNLSYKANDGTPKQVSLADGLNFKNGTLTTASIDDNGVVKYDVNTASITAGTDGTITGPTTDGVATAKNVADAINAAKKASKTEITANTGEAANATTGNVTLTSTTASDGHTIYDVKLNDKVTLGSGTNAVTVDGTTGAITGKTATIGSVTVNGTANTIGGLSNTTWNGTATTGRAATEDQLKAVADAASSQTWNITADKAGTTGAQTGTKKNATVGKDETVELVAGDNLTINQDERKFTYSLNKDLAGLTSVSVGTGTTETIKLDGAIGKITAKNAAIGGVTIDGDNKHVIGLSNTTWNGTATTGRAATEDQLKAVAETAKTTTDAVNLKFAGDTNTSPGVVNLKDDTLGIVGDGKYVSTDANGKNLTVKVSEAEVKKSAVAAVTVSTDTTDANNPISVTPTTSADGTTKDYKVTIDGTKIANKTNLSYKANDGTPKQVSLADGLNFKNGTLTTASIDDNGVVKYDVNTATITAGADGTITSPTTDGVATAQNVADAINAAKKASKTEITANTGEAANATTGNVTLTSTTAADGHTIYDVKLNDKVTLGSGANAVTIDGTAGKATIGSSVINGVNNTFTTGGAKAVTLDGATGTITGTTANIGGVTVNGTANTIGGLSNTTWNGTATTGRAATEDQLKAVADAAGSQTWEITADKKAGTSGAQTGTKENAKVGKDDKVSLIAGENLTVDQAGKNFTYSLNKDLVKMNSATFEATGGKTTVIKGDSIVHTDGANVNTSNATSNTITDGTNTTTITAGKAQIGTVDIDGVASKITTGGTNAVVVNGADGTVKTGNVTVTGGTTNDITGLSNTTVTGADFATKGRAATEEQLKAATGATTLKFAGDVATNTGSVNLKDDTFGIKGDGKYISTDVNGKNVNLTVSEAEVKKSAVAAVTVSTDTTDANNPLTVTPTTSADGTTKDYKVTIDGTKIANKTNLSYKANDGTAKQVSLADGLNFKNGTLTTASIDDAGVVKYDVNTAAITASADGTITGPTTDGVATAQNVADAINAAKKASKTEITANTGEVANATTGNVTLTSTTAADGHTIYDVKLNDKVTLGTGANAVTIDGTAGKATIGTSVIDGVNNTFTTGGVSPVTLNGATGTITGKTANIGGVTVNGTANTIGGLSNTTWNGTATTGRAATEDQLKAVADAAGSQTWEITADKKSGTSGAQTGTKENAKVGKDDKVSLIAGENLTVDQAGKNFTYSLNTDLVKMNSATFEATGGKTTVIKGDSIVQTDGTKVNTSTAGGNTVLDGTKSTETTATGQVIKDGTKTNTSTVDENTLVDGAKSNKTTVDSNVIDDGNGNVNTSIATSNTITDGTNTSAITAGKGQIGSVGIDGIASKITTGGANAVVINGADGTIKTGTVTVTGGTTNDITGLSNTTVTAADFATKGRAATEEQLKAVGEQTWQITADKDATTSGAQTGTKKDAKVGKDDKVQLIAGENMTVNQNEREFTFTLNKDLVKMNSATFEATGGKTTVIKGDSIVQTDGNKTNTATASGNTVANGTKSIETNGNVNTSNATSNTITDGTNTSTITAGKATIGSSVIDGVNNTFTTGGANAVKLDGAAGTIKTGTVTVTGGTTNDITGLSNTTVTAADFATKGRAATEEQLKAVGEQTWQITADKDAATSGAQTGTKKDAKVGKDDKVQLIAGENMTVNQNERDFTFTLNKDLVKMNSATFLGTGTNKTVITGDSITQTAGTQTNTSTAAGNTVVDGTKSTETTAAGQVIKDGTKTNTSTVDENTLVDGTKSNKTTVDSNVIDDGNGNVNTSNATSNTITDGTNTSTITAGKATI
ncbi:ESPR-type extended signal peptide-containing protein, partial [Veillonella sp.]|uniref:ESPR-type extended signal peptide-containing protein n=1 Tax=Veillonella sp. TaxID=1926307 RepID=UPI002914AD43